MPCFLILTCMVQEARAHPIPSLTSGDSQDLAATLTRLRRIHTTAESPDARQLLLANLAAFRAGPFTAQAMKMRLKNLAVSETSRHMGTPCIPSTLYRRLMMFSIVHENASNDGCTNSMHNLQSPVVSFFVQ